MQTRILKGYLCRTHELEPEPHRDMSLLEFTSGSGCFTLVISKNLLADFESIICC
jgi:hypothetical protein